MVVVWLELSSAGKKEMNVSHEHFDLLREGTIFCDLLYYIYAMMTPVVKVCGFREVGFFDVVIQPDMLRIHTRYTRVLKDAPRS